ncbi:MAG: YbaN family protein [Phyllobacterium sp.]
MLSRGYMSRAKRGSYVALGFLMLGLGIVGAFLPVMPTTIFLIFAAWFFGRSSPAMEAWLLDHRQFGPVLRNWREQGAIPPRAKALACLGMAAGYGVFMYSARPGLPLAMLVAAAMIGSAAYVVSRPNGK